MDRFFFGHVDQITEVLADRPLAVFVERSRKPKRAAVGQWTETGIDMVKARVHQRDGNNETAEKVREGAMGVDVGAEFVAAKKNVAAEERVTFAFEVELLRQPDDFVAVLFHPTCEMRRFAGAFFVAEIARDKTAADR